MEQVAQLAVLLVAVLLGAIVALLAVRLIWDASQSIQQYSKDVMSLSLESLASNEREVTRDRSLAELAKESAAMNLAIGQIYLTLRNSPEMANRTILSRNLQVGESPPAGAAFRPGVVHSPLPAEGLKETQPSAAQQNRESAFAVPT